MAPLTSAMLTSVRQRVLNFISKRSNSKQIGKPKRKALPPLPEHIPHSGRRKCHCYRCEPELYELSKHEADNCIDRFRPLGFGSHNVWYLAMQAVASFSTDAAMGFAQLHAKHKWEQFWGQSAEYAMLRSVKDLSTLDAMEVLKKPIEIFNQLFFLGQLPANILRIEWMKTFRGPGRSEAIPSWRGCTQSSESGTLIRLNPHHSSHETNPTGLLRTLLHEMVHVYFGRYGCYSLSDTSTCPHPACRTLARENIGFGGHGRAWQTLAKAIEDRGPRLLAGFVPWLGRLGTCIQDIKQGGWIPGECDLGVLFDAGLESNWVRLRARARDDDFVMFEVLRQRVMDEGFEEPEERKWKVGLRIGMGKRGKEGRRFSF